MDVQISLLRISVTFNQKTKVETIHCLLILLKWRLSTTYPSIFCSDFSKVREGVANPLTEETIVNDGELAPNGDDKLSTSTNTDTARVYVETLSASWSYQGDKKVLQNVTFDVSQVSKVNYEQLPLFVNLPFLAYIRMFHC